VSIVRAAVLAAIVLASQLGAVSADQPPSAEEFYARALEHMRGYAQPAFATYHASISGGLICSAQGGELACTLGPNTAKPHAALAVFLRESDGRVAVEKKGGYDVFGDSTFLNATWTGVDALIRRGFTGMGGDPQPQPPLAPAEPSNGTLHVIADVTAFSVENYDVYDAGAAACANGDAGHAVRLVPRRDPLQHPLTGATVDLRTDDLCSLRLNAKVSAAAGLVGATGGAQLDLQSAGRYVVVTDERFAVDLRAIGIAVRHVNVDIAYSGFAFPNSIDPTVFTTPSPSPPPDKIFSSSEVRRRRRINEAQSCSTSI
jgi:hypothetical protein